MCKTTLEVFTDDIFLAVLGTCATFSHWRELKKVAHVAVAIKQKNNGAVAVARN